MMGALEGGLSFQKGLGAVHSLSHALGGLQDLKLHHGTLNAILMPLVVRFNAPGGRGEARPPAAAMGLPRGGGPRRRARRPQPPPRHARGPRGARGDPRPLRLDRRAGARRPQPRHQPARGLGRRLPRAPDRSPGTLKITGLRVFVANASRTNFVFVKLYTDEGIDGVGEATLEWKTLTVVAALEELERALVGTDPFAVDATIERLHRDSYWRTGAVFRTALGAVEAAMLDIKGKALGVPVFELLGGRHRDRVRCYANDWFFGARGPTTTPSAPARAVAMGYRALKWDPSRRPTSRWTAPQRRRTIAIVEAVRAAVGPDVDLMLDVHGRLNVPTAIAMCRALAPSTSPGSRSRSRPRSIAALAEVRAASPVPIAAGERWYEPHRFAEALRLRAVDVLQPDVSHAGGLGVTKRIAHLAHDHLVPVAPHNPVGPVMNAMTLHLSVAIPNFTVFETSPSTSPGGASSCAKPSSSRTARSSPRPPPASGSSSSRRPAPASPTPPTTCRSSTARSTPPASPPAPRP